MLDVGLDYLLRHRAQRGSKVAPSPEMTAPVTTLQLRDFQLQQPRRTAFDVLNPQHHQQTWRERRKQMHMIPTHVALENRDVLDHTNLTDRIPRPQRDRPREHRIPILRYPHQVALDVVDRMRPVAIFCTSHSSRLPQQETLKLFCLKTKVSTGTLK